MTEKQIANAIVVELGRQAEAQWQRPFRVYGNEAGDLRAELPAGIDLDVNAIARAIDAEPPTPAATAIRGSSLMSIFSFFRRATSLVPGPVLPFGLLFVPLIPFRILDTRANGTPPLDGGVMVDVPMQTTGAVPANARAYALNITAIPTEPLGYLTVWAAGQLRPLASTLNSLDGSMTTNAAIVQAGTGGAISVFPSNTTHLVIDISGYFISSAATIDDIQ